MAQISAGGTVPDNALFLHPELLSGDFLRLSLERRNIVIDEDLNDKEKLTEIFVQHAMPLPQRSLPMNRWGRMMESKRTERKTKEHHNRSSSGETTRKRPLIVFDGSSTSTSIKVKKRENGDSSDQLDPSLAESTKNIHHQTEGNPANPAPRLCSTNPIREAKLSISNHGHNATGPVTDKTLHTVKSQQPMTINAIKIKRAAPKEESDTTNDLKPTEVKKKIQHVTWP
ncbi:ashwin isoform 2-T2 [Discoglossus pictus]